MQPALQGRLSCLCTSAQSAHCASLERASGRGPISRSEESKKVPSKDGPASSTSRNPTDSQVHGVGCVVCASCAGGVTA